MKVPATPARLYVDDMGRALPALRELTGENVRSRFPCAGVEVASIGGFLVVAGSATELAPLRVAAAMPRVRVHRAFRPGSAIEDRS
ncbi:hypothetical protein ACWDG1_27330 [Streptomyces sp. NPDC001177]